MMRTIFPRQAYDVFADPQPKGQAQAGGCDTGGCIRAGELHRQTDTGLPAARLWGYRQESLNGVTGAPVATPTAFWPN